MFRSLLLVLIAGVLTTSAAPRCLAEEPHEVWLKAIEGTWTWDDNSRGTVTVTFKPQAGGKCMLGVGNDKAGTFVAIIGWEPWNKSLTDTGFHSSGGGGRIVYDEITPTSLKGVKVGAGPNGEILPKSKFHVVRDGDKITVTSVDAQGEKTTNVLRRVVTE